MRISFFLFCLVLIFPQTCFPQKHLILDFDNVPVVSAINPVVWSEDCIDWKISGNNGWSTASHSGLNALFSNGGFLFSNTGYYFNVNSAMMRPLSLSTWTAHAKGFRDGTLIYDTTFDITGAWQYVQLNMVGISQLQVYIGQTAVIMDDIDIDIPDFDPTMILNLGPDLIVPDSQTVTLDAGLHNSYLWSTGENTQIITIDTSGFGIGLFEVWAQITDSTCTVSDTVTVEFVNTAHINDLWLNRLYVYPNPTNGFLNYYIVNGEAEEVYIFSLDGKLLIKSTHLQESFIDLTSVPDGKYLFVVKWRGSVISQIIEKRN